MSIASFRLSRPQPKDSGVSSRSSKMPHDDQEIMMTMQPEATAIHAVPAEWLERGFRLLVLRELHTKKRSRRPLPGSSSICCALLNA